MYKNLGKVFRVIITSCLALLLSTSAVTFFILCWPIFIYRIFVSQISVFHPDLSKLIPARSNNHAVDKIFTKPKCSILLSQVGKGNVDIEEFIQMCCDKLMDIRRPNGELQYMEGRQYPYQWMGFNFWRWDNNFDIRNHIKYYTFPGIPKDSKIPQSKLRELEAELIAKPYVEKRSPWEVLIIENVESDPDSNPEENHSMVIIRFHHCIADGYSVMKIFFKALFNDGTGKEQVIVQPNFVKRSGFRLFLAGLKMAILGPYELAQHLLGSIDYNEWKIAENNVKDKMLYSLSEIISLKLLKEIRTAHNVGLSAVIFAAFTASVRKAMLKKNGKVPENIHCVLPVPVPGHPDDKLTNHASLVCLKLPVGESNSLKRLHMTNKNLESLTKSYLPMLTFYISGLYGSLFPWMTRLWQNNLLTTAGGTSFPGSKRPAYYKDQEITDTHITVGPFPGNTAVVFTTCSQNENIRMKIAVNTNIFDKQEDLDEMQQTMLDEIRLLQNSASKRML